MPEVLNVDERRMLEIAWTALHKDAVRQGAAVPPARTLLDCELLLWAEREGLTFADVVRINT